MRLESEANAALITEFDHAMVGLGPFEASPQFAVAVSGGGDSLALTFLLANWVKARGGRLTGLTVDHGLRVEFWSEAEQVRLWFATHDIGHETLTWTGVKPKTAVQAMARAARYDLLTGWCRDNGILHLAVGHNHDDQLETVWMRRQRQQSGIGLAGMARRRVLSGVQILRPLLSVRRSVLREFLKQLQQDWLDDPSNDDQRYERVRARTALAQLDDASWRRLASETKQAQVQREREESALSKIIAALVTLHPTGYASCPADKLRALSRVDAGRLLQRVLQVVGCAEYAPKITSVERLIARLLAATTPLRGSLANCLIREVRGEIIVCRETRQQPPAVELRDGIAEWGNFRIDYLGENEVEGLQIGALVLAKLRDKSIMADIERLPKAVRATLPAIWKGDEIVCLPRFGSSADSQNSGFCAEFRPKSALCRNF